MKLDKLESLERKLDSISFIYAVFLEGNDVGGGMCALTSHVRTFLHFLSFGWKVITFDEPKENWRK